jgi:hypothetical protein
MIDFRNQSDCRSFGSGAHLLTAKNVTSREAITAWRYRCHARAAADSFGVFSKTLGGFRGACKGNGSTKRMRRGL